VPTAGCIGDGARADGLAFVGLETAAGAVRFDVLHTREILYRGAVVDDRVCQIGVGILAEQVRFIAFPVGRDDQLV